MSVSPEVSGVAAVALVGLAALASFACRPANAPPTAIEVDLCKARSAFRAAELIDPALVPVPGSVRALVESDEDALCAAQGQ